MAAKNSSTSTFMFQIFDFDKQKVTNGGSQALLISSFAVKWFTNNHSRWRAESDLLKNILGSCSIPIGSCHHHLKVHNKD